MGVKDTNPKDSVGVRKRTSSCIPQTVLSEVGLGLLEGALKYGRHNYRVSGVLASVYFDATDRHMKQWWEGEDIDPDSGISHISKAIASLVVLRDAMIQGMLTDDRPPPAPKGWYLEHDKAVEALLDRYPGPKPAHTKDPA